MNFMADDEFKTEVLSQLNRLNTAILGDEKAGVDGIVSRVRENSTYIQSLKEEKIITKVQDHETYISKDIKFKDAIKNKIVGIMIIGTPLGVIAWKIIVDWVSK